MRAFCISWILVISAISLASNAGQVQTTWEGPQALQMDKANPTIDPNLSSHMSALPAGTAFHVWVFFTDKGIFGQSEYGQALLTAQDNLTPAARERRLKARGRDNLVDFRDLSVNTLYINQVLAAGPALRQVVRWFNAVSVKATSDQVNAIAILPFVRLVKSVAHSTVDYRVDLTPVPNDLSLVTLNYGPSRGQLDQIDVVPAHELGFKGQGVLICMMDVGYRQGHVAFQNIIESGRLLAQYDFINHDNNTDYDPDQDSPEQPNHGTLTWSTLGGESSGHLYGPSYLADFILAKTEDVTSERHIEEDNWAAGAQWADSIGAAVISSSLGYRFFDAGQGDYSYSDLEGNTTIVTQAADLAAFNGITVCNAMGNDGYEGSGSLIAPADADSVISCGAVDGTGILAGFSSLGPTYDGRIKPEVCAQGVSTVCADPYDMSSFSQASGTSLSTPLVGGSAGVLLSAHPNWTPMMVREALMMTADKFDSPDNSMGWGIMDVSRGLYYHPQGDMVFVHRPIVVNPAGQPINISVNVTGGAGFLSVFLYYRPDTSGSFTEIQMTSPNGRDFSAQIPQLPASVVQYYFKAMDSVNAHAFHPLGGQAHPFAVSLGASQVTDSFDNGILLWESGGTNNFWGLSTKYTRTGNLSITDSPAGNYRNSTDSWLRTAFSLDFSGSTSASLTFYWRGILETGHDTLLVEASSDGGSTWARFSQAITGTRTTFTQYTAALAAYVGQPDVRLRFHIVTDAAGRREGIYIDDVAVNWAPTGVNDNQAVNPSVITLNQNYPNPFNPSTVISFSLAEKSRVDISIFDLLGRRVRDLLSADLEAGWHQVTWDGTSEVGVEVASGVYLYRLEFGGASEVRRMTLVR